MTGNESFDRGVAYLIILILLWGLSKTAIGYRVIYLALWTILVLLLVRNANRITAILTPLTGQQPSSY